MRYNAACNDGASNVLGVLSNDMDPEGGPLQAELVSTTSHGQLELNDDGTFTYSPVENYFGSDSFEYRASDLHGAVSTATVDITVIPGPNEAPLVGDRSCGYHAAAAS